jgi:dephospho-CoA kinase
VIILGLTGSIGMGKSTAAAVLKAFGLPLFDADQIVHRLLESGGAAVAPVAKAFPDIGTRTGGIDRKQLGRRVFADPAALARLEAIIHPMVEAAEKRFLAYAHKRRAAIVVLDIPLLFETGSERRCDFVLVVSAPEFLQRQRVLRRPAMNQERFAAILREQMPDAEKQRRSDFVIPTGLNRKLSLRRLRAIVRLVRDRPAGMHRKGRHQPRRRRRRG